jgi:uncharacterized protein YqjF (DUF2071 family)
MASPRDAPVPVSARLDARRRPSGRPVLHQRWQGLLFLHWAFDPAQLGCVLPAGLHLDTFEGRAWVGVTPFNVSRMRPTLLPALPWLSEASEINLRVYVHRDGIPGIWFPSLEITNRLAMWGARLAYQLPYFHARMDVAQNGDAFSFRSERSGANGQRAMLDVQWHRAEPLPAATPGTLEFFLIERYVLYCGEPAGSMRARIHHRPWPLRNAKVLHLTSTLLEAAAGIPRPATPVLAHAQAEPLDVEVWPPTHV